MEREHTSIYGMILGAIFTCTLLWSAAASATIPEDKSSAVVFVYQRIGEDAVPQGNISIEQFEEHISELKKGGYSVLPLSKIIDAVKSNTPLPPKTVAITFEGAYQATLANAVPLLDDAQMPFTVFFSSDELDDSSTGHMTWDQLKKLKKDKLAGLGILPATYEHLVNQTPEKSAELINRAVSRYREMLGEEPDFFAYPYGEFNNALRKQIGGYKFKAAFGQQSGVVYNGADLTALPRFTMTDEYGDLDRFLLTAHALPLPVIDVVPDDMVITQNPPTIGFTITPELTNLAKLSCFASDTGKLPLTHIDNNRIEIRLTEALTDRRTRINCTLPNETFTAGEQPNWRWFGMLLTSPSVEEEATADSSAEDMEGSHDDETPENPPKK